MSEFSQQDGQEQRRRIAEGIARHSILHCDMDGTPNPDAALPPVPAPRPPKPRLDFSFMRSLNSLPGNPFYKEQPSHE